MSMFTICTSIVADGKLDDTRERLVAVEKSFTSDIGVGFRQFFQCTVQPHILWTLTEWTSEKHHNDAAQSLIKKRRDDRIASILCGPEPYWEIFCAEEKEFGMGDFSESLRVIVVAHGLINTKAQEKFLTLRKERFTEVATTLRWLRIYHNSYNPYEFVAFAGFIDEESFNHVRHIGDLLLEEYLFTGLRKPFGMSYLAGYNQFICTPFLLTER